MKLRLPWELKSGFHGHPRSPDPKLGGFVVIWGQNKKILEPKQIIYQNEAFGLRVSRGHMRTLHPKFWSFGVKKQKFQILVFDISKLSFRVPDFKKWAFKAVLITRAQIRVIKGIKLSFSFRSIRCIFCSKIKLKF